MIRKQLDKFPPKIKEQNKEPNLEQVYVPKVYISSLNECLWNWFSQLFQESNVHFILWHKSPLSYIEPSAITTSLTKFYFHIVWHVVLSFYSIISCFVFFISFSPLSLLPSGEIHIISKLLTLFRVKNLEV